MQEKASGNMGGFIRKPEIERERELILELWGEAFYQAALESSCSSFLEFLAAWEAEKNSEKISR